MITKTKDQRPKADVAALLLAAGQSRRMGAFKPLLPFGNTTVIHSCIQNLRGAGVDQIVVVLGHRAAEVQASLNDPQLSFSLNPQPDSEMSTSIICGLQQLPAKTGAVLIALADHPATPPEAIEAVINAWQNGARLIVPEFQGHGGHPVLVDLVFREELMRLDPGFGLRSLFIAHKDEVKRLALKSPFVARDMDTWDDYRALHDEIFGNSPNDIGR
ncbi:MAG: nucleotidyltransferase family protein [bacterium]